tara:strand:- start:578 stop:1549 length:972 start_codon:yes stop_codon:yes gene_type:complete
MADRINKFGQEVTLIAYDAAGVEIFQTDTLRVDFDIRHIETYTRAKIGIFNLSPDTIKLLTKPKSIFLTLWVSLHGATPVKIASDLYVSNAINEIKVPDSELCLYCTSKYKENLDRPVDVWVKNPTLSKVIKKVFENSGYNGLYELRHFPAEYLSYVNYRPTLRQGSLMTVLESMGEEYGFTVFTENNIIVLLYRCQTANYKTSTFEREEHVVKLSSNNLRSSPKIGIAAMSIVSNLDLNIKPGAVLDISDLTTASVDLDFTKLAIGLDLVQQGVAGFNKYQVQKVQHKGSNWIDLWQTQAVAHPPTQGESMNTDAWWTPYSY